MCPTSTSGRVVCVRRPAKLSKDAAFSHVYYMDYPVPIQQDEACGVQPASQVQVARFFFQSLANIFSLGWLSVFGQARDGVDRTPFLTAAGAANKAGMKVLVDTAVEVGLEVDVKAQKQGGSNAMNMALGSNVSEVSAYLRELKLQPNPHATKARPRSSRQAMAASSSHMTRAAAYAAAKAKAKAEGKAEGKGGKKGKKGEK